ncbi:MAG TPA: OsmC family protein [Flavobacterium sp.]|nr:OsmC family protein [Flavobacterium sp.]
MHKVVTEWKGNMAFESNLPDGIIKIDVPESQGGNGSGMRPKALMLSSLAGCSGLDVASLMKKMRLKVDDFRIETEGLLTDDDAAVYHSVTIRYVFSGKELEKEKLEKAVNLSVEKYCGVMKMFEKFAEVKIETAFHKI